MKIKVCITAIVLTLFTNTYADDSSSIQEGAQSYDWQTCIDKRSGDCKNGCATSSDINCSDNCNDLAKDKCQAEGVRPPQ